VVAAEVAGCLAAEGVEVERLQHRRMEGISAEPASATLGSPLANQRYASADCAYFASVPLSPRFRFRLGSAFASVPLRSASPRLRYTSADLITLFHYFIDEVFCVYIRLGSATLGFASSTLHLGGLNYIIS
jgi:hypothetical protein